MKIWEDDEKVAKVKEGPTAEEEGTLVEKVESLQKVDTAQEENNATAKNSTPSSLPELEDVTVIEDDTPSSDQLNRALLEPNSEDTPLQISDLGTILRI